jgi:isocitrate lyase
MEPAGYSATRHQQEVGTGYFDRVSEAITGGLGSTLALRGSTEEAQFEEGKASSNGHGPAPVVKAEEAPAEPALD